MNAPRGGGSGGGGGGGAKGKQGGGAKANNRGGRPRRNRNKGNRNRGARGGARRGPPQSPQTKVCFRNIGNTEVYGTVEAIATNIIQPILQQANERLEHGKISLDETSLQKLIEGDKLAAHAAEEWKKRQEGGGEGEQENEAEEAGEPETPDDNNKTEEKEDNDAAAAALVKGMKDLDMKEKSDSDNSTIFARPLYVVPPKKTRRRGEKPGNAYLILTTPPIPAVETAPPPVEEAPAAVEGEPESSQVAEAVPPLPAKVDYSRQMAERQLALVRAVEVMTSIAAQDTQGQWAGCVVEEAKNGKSWRPPQRKDHREGTVEESPGFKAFLEMTAKEKEDLQSRPKPAPGGGLAALSTGLGATTNESGKPVAALVLHLQKKREHEKVLKKKKRKAKKAGSAGTDNNNNNNATNNGKAEGKKRNRQRKNKRNAAKKAEAKP